MVLNRLNREFDVQKPNYAWVTDITYIRTHEGWLYLAVVVDLFSRRVIGWSMQPRITKDLSFRCTTHGCVETQSSSQDDGAL